MVYNPDIFYNTAQLTKNDCVKLFTEAKDLSYKWWVDGKLNQSWTRSDVDLTFDQIISCFKKTKRSSLHITFIHRRGCDNWVENLEIGFCTLGRKWRFSETDDGGDLFLWIEVNTKHKQYLLEKYLKTTCTSL